MFNFSVYFRSSQNSKDLFGRCMFLMSLVSAGWGFKEVLPVDWLLQLSIK